MNVTDLTPWELRNGLWYKRDDLYRDPETGVNGSKLRALRYLMAQAVLEQDAKEIISGSSVHAPRAAMCAVLAEEMGLGCTIIVGGTTPAKALKHRVIQIAADRGASIQAIPVGYNPALQKAASSLAAERPFSWVVPYVLGPAADAAPADVSDFLEVNGRQVANMPEQVETLVIPFGSGSSAAGILYGLAIHGVPAGFKRLALVGIGPDRLAWLEARLRYVDPNLWDQMPFELVHMPLHPWFAEYGDRMPETLDDLVLHPTYEGKVARFLNTAKPDWWIARDGKTALWIVGGPF